MLKQKKVIVLRDTNKARLARRVIMCSRYDEVGGFKRAFVNQRIEGKRDLGWGWKVKLRFNETKARLFEQSMARRVGEICQK